MIRCSACNSALQEHELNDGSCPFCHPKIPVLVRKKTPVEFEVAVKKGCPNGHGKFKFTMGVYFCKECGAMPPTHVPIKKCGDTL